MIVIGVDPGPEESAYVLWDGAAIIEKRNVPNGVLLTALRDTYQRDGYRLAIERVRGFGIMASDGLFDTCEFVGRCEEAFGEEYTAKIPRKEVAKHICQNSGVSHDKFIREALIKRFGGSEAVALGKKATPGPLHGMSSHLWSALAVALTYWDREVRQVPELFS